MEHYPTVDTNQHRAVFNPPAPGVYAIGGKSQHLLTISGKVFDDFNKNGTKDLAEAWRPNWTVFLEGPYFMYTRTDMNGHYSFPIYFPGDYEITPD